MVENLAKIAEELLPQLLKDLICFSLLGETEGDKKLEVVTDLKKVQKALKEISIPDNENVDKIQKLLSTLLGRKDKNFSNKINESIKIWKNTEKSLAEKINLSLSPFLSDQPISTIINEMLAILPVNGEYQNEINGIQNLGKKYRNGIQKILVKAFFKEESTYDSITEQMVLSVLSGEYYKVESTQLLSKIDNLIELISNFSIRKDVFTDEIFEKFNHYYIVKYKSLIKETNIKKDRENILKTYSRFSRTIDLHKLVMLDETPSGQSNNPIINRSYFASIFLAELDHNYHTDKEIQDELGLLYLYLTSQIKGEDKIYEIVIAKTAYMLLKTIFRKPNKKEDKNISRIQLSQGINDGTYEINKTELENLVENSIFNKMLKHTKEIYSPSLNILSEEDIYKKDLKKEFLCLNGYVLHKDLKILSKSKNSKKSREKIIKLYQSIQDIKIDNIDVCNNSTPAFDKIAFNSLKQFVFKQRIRVFVKDIQNISLKKIEGIEKEFLNLKSLYTDFNNSFKRVDDKDQRDFIVIQNFLVCLKFLIKEIKFLINQNRNSFKKKKCHQLLKNIFSFYRNNLDERKFNTLFKLNKEKYLMPLYLKYEDCFVADELDGQKVNVFIDTAHTLPIDFDKHKLEYDQIRREFETDYQFVSSQFAHHELELTGKEIQKEIQKNQYKSVQVLGIFSALLAFIVTSVNIISTKVWNVYHIVFFLLSLAFLLAFMVLLISSLIDNRRIHFKSMIEEFKIITPRRFMLILIMILLSFVGVILVKNGRLNLIDNTETNSNQGINNTIIIDESTEGDNSINVTDNIVEDSSIVIE